MDPLVHSNYLGFVAFFVPGGLNPGLGRSTGLPIRMFWLTTLSLGSTASANRSITVVNNCRDVIWPGLFSQAGSASSGGFELHPQEQQVVNVTNDWDGRMFARQGCVFNSTMAACQVCNCGPDMACPGSNQPPCSLGEWNMNGYANQTFFDMSLVDGFNVGISIHAVQANVTPVCNSHLDDFGCPPGLKRYDADGNYEACWSFCAYSQMSVFCCTGSYDSPQSCRVHGSARTAKHHCPDAYTWPFDDKTSTFTVPSSNDFVVHFCPTQRSTILLGQATSLLFPRTLVAFLTTFAMYWSISM